MKSFLSWLKDTPVLIDANIFMKGLEYRATDPDYSFSRMKDIVFEPLLNFCNNIIIHEVVYGELDDESKNLIDFYIGKGITVVAEGDLYGLDPQYTELWNKVANHEIFNYERGERKNAGEIYSLVYALHNGIPYFCSADGLVDLLSDEMSLNVEIITFDVVLLIASIHHRANIEFKKAIKAMYKRLCADVIRRRRLPTTLGDYIALVDKQGWLN